jgi:hypothetical protein
VAEELPLELVPDVETQIMKDLKVLTTTGNESQYRSNVQFAEDPRWLLAQRIVASKMIAKSSFLTNFLLYVCDRELQGKSTEITEYQIGIQAFGRPADYNPGIDNIVRNYARLLRKRLEEYFETEGSHELLRISIPRGGYVPIFHPPETTQAISPAHTVISDIIASGGLDRGAKPLEPVLPLERRSSPVVRNLLLSLAACAAIAVGSFELRRFSTAAQTTPSQQLWNQIFNRGRETLIVPADSGLGILQNLTRRPVHLGDYVTGTYLTESSSVTGMDSRNVKDLRTQRYTSAVDLNIALGLSHLPELVPDRFSIRYARDLRMEDLKHANAVLLGSIHTNPWVELYQKELNFSFEYQPEVDESEIRNLHPLDREDSVYTNEWADDSHRTYAVLAFVPSLDGIGYVILLEGLNMAGTQAAADFLFSPNTMNPVLRKAQRPDGTIQPFELLLETSSIGANPTEAWVVAERYGSGHASALSSTAEQADQRPDHARSY